MGSLSGFAFGFELSLGALFRLKSLSFQLRRFSLGGAISELLWGPVRGLGFEVAWAAEGDAEPAVGRSWGRTAVDLGAGVVGWVSETEPTVGKSWGRRGLVVMLW